MSPGLVILFLMVFPSTTMSVGGAIVQLSRAHGRSIPCLAQLLGSQGSPLASPSLQMLFTNIPPDKSVLHSLYEPQTPKPSTNVPAISTRMPAHKSATGLPLTLSHS